MLIFAIVGVAIGIGLSTWEPDDPQDKETTVKWLGLIGDMFIRALKAVVLPLVFVNVILSMVDMMSVGRASAVGGKTIGLVSSGRMRPLLTSRSYSLTLFLPSFISTS